MKELALLWVFFALFSCVFHFIIVALGLGATPVSVLEDHTLHEGASVWYWEGVRPTGTLSPWNRFLSLCPHFVPMSQPRLPFHDGALGRSLRCLGTVHSNHIE